MTARAEFVLPRPGDALPVREFRPDIVQMFFYNAALWNAHRIHFDHAYATQVEGHPGLVIAGPLLGDYLAQLVLEWLGDAGRLASIEYSNRRVSYVGEVLRATGRVQSVDRQQRSAVLELCVLNEAGEVTTPGTAVVRFAAG
jgi:hydroxyacyl-ACP dehydratase HTD2-like protein with hotdog domain